MNHGNTPHEGAEEKVVSGEPLPYGVGVVASTRLLSLVTLTRGLHPGLNSKSPLRG